MRVLTQRRVDGVRLVPDTDSSGSIELLRKHELPVVVLDRRIRSGGVDEVRADSEGGAYLAVRHLIDLGHHSRWRPSGAAALSAPMSLRPLGGPLGQEVRPEDSSRPRAWEPRTPYHPRAVRSRTGTGR